MIIEPRFNGPSGTGNGGYSAGVFAAALTAASAGRGPAMIASPIEVTLRRPPPLDVPLTVVGDEVHAPDGEVIARGGVVEPFEALVPAVPWEQAVHASRSYAGFANHPFPTCYVCGPSRPDGLRIFPGPVVDGRTAAPFVVPDNVTLPTVWAALDCPGGWSIIAPGRPYVLGRMAAVVVSALPAPGDQCVVVGATLGTEGRKAQVYSTLYGPSGDPLAYARATWIAI